MVSFFITLFFGLILFSIGFNVLQHDDNELITFGRVMFCFGAGVSVASIILIVLSMMRIIK